MTDRKRKFAKGIRVWIKAFYAPIQVYTEYDESELETGLSRSTSDEI